MNKKKLTNSTIVPIDFSEASELALEHASAMAQVIDDETQEITLVHVIEDRKLPFIGPDTDLSQFDNRTALMIDGSRTRLEKVKEKFQPKVKVPINFVITGGSPYKRISELAEEIESDSIVMGTKGASGWDAFLGSNAAKVIQVSPCPVVVINERNFEQGYKNIVLPLDLTKETKQKVSLATKVAKFFNSTIHLVSVAEDDKHLQKKIKANLKQVENYLKDQGISHTSEILTDVEGNFADATLKYSQQMGADLIIIMTQQERSFKELIIGSYAQQIVNKSRTPVMCVNPRQDLKGVYERLSPGF